MGGMAERGSSLWRESQPQTRPKEDGEGYRWHEDIMDREDEDDGSDKGKALAKTCRDAVIVAKIRCDSLRLPSRARGSSARRPPHDVATMVQY